MHDWIFDECHWMEIVAVMKQHLNPAKHCYFGCLRFPDVDGIKMFDKDDQVAKH